MSANNAKGLFLLVLVLKAAMAPAAETVELKKVSFGIDEFCPYTCLEKDRPGIVPETVAEILKRRNIELDLYIASWTRLKKKGEQGAVDLLGPVTTGYIKTTNAPATKIFGGYFAAGFVTRAESSWKFTGMESLKNVKSAAVKGYTLPPELSAYYDKIRNTPYLMELTGEDAYRRRVLMLANNRVDTIYCLYDVFLYQLSYLHLNPEEFRKAGDLPLPEDARTYRIGAYSKDPERNKKLIDILDRGFVELNKDGTFRKILERYRIKDPGKLVGL